MTPQDFIAKWQAVELKERSASQSHFNDLCRRHPPRPMVSHRSHGANFIRGKFPPVDPDKDWCGEWKRAKRGVVTDLPHG